MTNTALTNNSINVDTAGNTLMTINLDELQSAYESKCNELKVQISKQHNKMEQMHAQLQKNFEQQIQQLKLKMESNTKKLVFDFDKCFQMVMHKIEELVVDRTEMQMMIKEKMHIILQAIQVKNNGYSTPKIGNTPQCPHKTPHMTPNHDPCLVPMNINQHIQADRSLPNNPTASHANHNNDGSQALAGVTK